MQLVDLKFKPGIDKQDTAYSAGDERKYVDSDFVRFHYGKPERWGGWTNLPNPNVTVVGVVRDTHSWIGLDRDWETKSESTYLRSSPAEYAVSCLSMPGRNFRSTNCMWE